MSNIFISIGAGSAALALFVLCYFYIAPEVLYGSRNLTPYVFEDFQVSAAEKMNTHYLGLAFSVVESSSHQKIGILHNLSDQMMTTTAKRR